MVDSHRLREATPAYEETVSWKRKGIYVEGRDIRKQERGGMDEHGRGGELKRERGEKEESRGQLMFPMAE